MKRLLGLTLAASAGLRSPRRDGGTTAHSRTIVATTSTSLTAYTATATSLRRSMQHGLCLGRALRPQSVGTGSYVGAGEQECRRQVMRSRSSFSRLR